MKMEWLANQFITLLLGGLLLRDIIFFIESGMAILASQ